MNILHKILNNKEKEVEICKNKLPFELFGEKLISSQRSFKEAISETGSFPNLIAEIKKASPSEGVIKKDFDHLEIAGIYNKYAQAISILTDKEYFQGSIDFLKDISEISSVPLLRKDFIIDEYQIYEARYYSADAVLLIAAILDAEQIDKFKNIASKLGMDCLVEIHNEEELEKVINTSAEIIGINNRNLKDFSIDLNTTVNLAQIVRKRRPEIVLVSESGINSRENLDQIREYVNAVLIGTLFMKSDDIEKKINQLFNNNEI